MWDVFYFLIFGKRKKKNQGNRKGIGRSKFQLYHFILEVWMGEVSLIFIPVVLKVPNYLFPAPPLPFLAPHNTVPGSISRLIKAYTSVQILQNVFLFKTLQHLQNGGNSHLRDFLSWNRKRIHPVLFLQSFPSSTISSYYFRQILQKQTSDTLHADRSYFVFSPRIGGAIYPWSSTRCWKNCTSEYPSHIPWPLSSCYG